jgi:dihydrofolate synthase/folylpolyglutamate synthase
MLRYNERIRIAGQEAGDAALVEAFARIDAARGESSLTYFEFGTLAAFDLFERAGCDCWLLEVGLGGRLDAVNVVDADVAVLTSISLDHTDWLGRDRDTIAIEKAGIFRRSRPAVYGEADMPASIGAEAERIGADLYRLGQGYRFERHAKAWSFRGPAGNWEALPQPALPGGHQLANAAAGLAALQLLADRLPVPVEAVRAGLARAALTGRMQVLPGAVEWLLDVAHNQASVEVLAGHLKERPVTGRCHAVFAQMQRKELESVVRMLAGLVDAWWLLELPDADARPAAEVASCLRRLGLSVAAQGGAGDVFGAVSAAAKPGDRVLVFGSFRTVEEALRYHAHVSGDQ